MRTATSPITFRWINYMYCFLFCFFFSLSLSLADLDAERIALFITRNKTGIVKEVLGLVLV